MNQILSDNKCRRSGVDRREIFYTMHIPERRSGNDRRSGLGNQVHQNSKDYFNRQG